MNITHIRDCDYDNNYVELLQQLSNSSINKITKEEFILFISTLHQNHQILVIQDNETNKIIGSITILVENKLIHDIGKVCHVEDLVIDHAYRGKGLGKILINTCINISKNMGCYKTILNCSPTNILFYEKCNFKQMNAQMSLYN